MITMAIKANAIDAVIFTGTASLDPANEYRASDDPEQPKAYLLDPQIPQGATSICAWYTPLESVDGLTGFATISVNSSPAWIPQRVWACGWASCGGKRMTSA